MMSKLSNSRNQIQASEALSDGSGQGELVENSLDAGASQITIETRGRPKTIQVTDNGEGIVITKMSSGPPPCVTSKSG